jgi:hypothetical protein
METETVATTTVRKCSICGEEGHNKSNRSFHPLEPEVIIEETPIEEPLILDIPIIEEEPLILDIPTIVEETLTIVEAPIKLKTIFNTLHYNKKKPTEYHQLKVGR